MTATTVVTPTLTTHSIQVLLCNKLIFTSSRSNKRMLQMLQKQWEKKNKNSNRVPLNGQRSYDDHQHGHNDAWHSHTHIEKRPRCVCVYVSVWHNIGNKDRWYYDLQLEHSIGSGKCHEKHFTNSYSYCFLVSCSFRCCCCCYCSVGLTADLVFYGIYDSNAQLGGREKK